MFLDSSNFYLFFLNLYFASLSFYLPHLFPLSRVLFIFAFVLLLLLALRIFWNLRARSLSLFPSWFFEDFTFKTTRYVCVYKLLIPIHRSRPMILRCTRWNSPLMTQSASFIHSPLRSSLLAELAFKLISYYHKRLQLFTSDPLMLRSIYVRVCWFYIFLVSFFFWPIRQKNWVMIFYYNLIKLLLTFMTIEFVKFNKKSKTNVKFNKFYLEFF